MLENINSPKDIKKLSNDELNELASEIRELLVKNISKTGGHLASNLGVVELTLAIHSIFNAPRDKIIWDVGHQTYVHKIITGRRDRFKTIRQFGGISGFPRRDESEYDFFGAGHSSTSISAALGIARARNLKGENYNVVAVIGDGALTGGMAFEALNDAGRTKTQLMVILNDNEMSIAHNVGSLSKYLSRLRSDPAYFRMKSNIDGILDRIPEIGPSIKNSIKKIKNSIKSLVVPGMLFENLGFTYFGPMDGHNIAELKDALSSAKNFKTPVIIHVVTKKGKGYDKAEKDPEHYHGIEPLISGADLNSKKPTYSEVFGDKIVDLAKHNRLIVAITAAMPYGTGLNKFKSIFPDRFFDVGIAEQHAATMAAGMAANGLKPVFAVYSTFLQRGYDQIVHDICIQKLPVTLAIDRAGVVGEDGETHNGLFDLSYLLHIPNLTVLAPSNGDELNSMLEYAVNSNKPVAIRYPKGECTLSHIDISFDEKAELIHRGDDLTIIAEGRMVEKARKITENLAKSNINAELINARILKPFDKDLLISSVKKTKRLVTMEDNVKIGGMGSLILEILSDEGLRPESMLIGWPDEFITHGSIADIFKYYKLDDESITNRILKFLNK